MATLIAPQRPGRPGSLRDRLREEPQLPIADAVALTSEIARALATGRHSAGSLLVSPENILLLDGHAVPARAGEARELDPLRAAAYTSPEQAAGHRELDERAEQYALACVLYEMLAGEPPFGGPTAEAILARHAADPVPPLRSVRPTVPSALEDALQRGLAKSPADRYATTGEFAVAIERSLTAAPEPRARLAAAPRLAIRRRVALAIAVIAIVAAVAMASLGKPEPPAVYIQNRVVAASLENQGGDPAVDVLAAQLLSTLPDAIAREGVGEPVPAATVREVLRQARGTPGEIAHRLARETGAGLQLRGTCSRLGGGRTACQMDLLRMPAGTLRMSASVTGDPADPGFATELSERMLVMLFLQQTYGDRATWRGEYIPRSLVAVRKRVEADDAGEWKRYEELLYADSAWATAWAVAAVHSAMNGKISFDSAASTLKRLAARPNLLPAEREVVRYWLASLEGDSEVAYQMLRRRFAANPREWCAAAVLFAMATNRPHATLAIAALTDSLLYADSTRNELPHPAIFEPWGDALHQLGRHREELELGRELRRRFPGKIVRSTRTIEVMALAALGEVDTLRRLIAEWDATPEGPGSAGTRGFIAGQELIAHGHEVAGRAMLEETLPFYRRLRDSTGYASWNEIWVLTWLGRLDEARRLGLAVLAKTPPERESVGYLGPLGIIAARQGQRAEAARYDRLLASFDKTLFLGGAVGFFRAQIAAALGDRAGAMRHLAEARSREAYGTYSMPSTHRSVHRWPDLASLRGYPPFEQFLRPGD